MRATSTTRKHDSSTKLIAYREHIQVPFTYFLPKYIAPHIVQFRVVQFVLPSRDITLCISDSCLQDKHRALSGMQSLNLSASSIIHLAVNPQLSASILSPVAADLPYRDASRPSFSERIAAEVPSIGSHNRDMGGRIYPLCN